MIYVLVRHEVEDYARWLAVFDNHEKVRRASGGGDYQLFRDAFNPNQITILFEWDSIENARRFVESEDLRNTMQTAGVITRPDVSFLHATR